MGVCCSLITELGLRNRGLEFFVEFVEVNYQVFSTG